LDPAKVFAEEKRCPAGAQSYRALLQRRPVSTNIVDTLHGIAPSGFGAGVGIPFEAIPQDYSDQAYQRFAMITAGFFMEHITQMCQNAIRYYLALALFHNPNPDLKRDEKGRVVNTGNPTKARAFPKPSDLDTILQEMNPARQSEAVAVLETRGLVERWSEPSPNGRRIWRFWRLPFVDNDGRHQGGRQKPSARELLSMKEAGTLPKEFQWVKSSKLRTPLHRLG
jgi:hypothetical protein